MLFLTYWFVLFMSVAFPLYWVARHRTLRLVILLVACVVFHTHFAGPAGVLPIIFLGLITYAAGLSRNRTACQLGIAACAGSLVFYKYTRFLCTQVVGAFSHHARDWLAGYHLSPTFPVWVLAVLLLATVTVAAGLERKRVVFGVGLALTAASVIFHPFTRRLCDALMRAMTPGGDATPAQDPLLTSVVPPLAISFFAFEFIHYLVDVLRGAPSIRRPIQFALFSIFWPSIVAGPVKRYREFLPALREGVRGVSQHDVAVGLVLVALGLVKKFVADNLTAWLTFYGPHFEAFSLRWRWAFVAFVAFRILLDFSGYSDMAIGFARMHGIRLSANFNWPYLATSITSFWRRWHISLSNWIRDYVYIALGGNRRGTARKAANGLLAFGLCGLWHGAGWNFLFWGLYHGAGLAVASNYRTVLGRAGAALGRALDRNLVVGWALTMLFVGVGWLFFFYPLPDAFHMARLLCLRH